MFATPSKKDSEGATPVHSKGQASRATILLTAAKLATLRGLERLSIGDLAAEVGMSKSGLYAHFKSKEDLEVATIDTAAEIFSREVLHPAMQSPIGIERLRALVNSFLEHLERRVFPGGCFFAAVAIELDTRPGQARDKVMAIQQQWHGLLKQCIIDASTAGEIDSNADATQAGFEIGAMLLAANYSFVMMNDSFPLSQARTGIENILVRLQTTVGTK